MTDGDLISRKSVLALIDEHDYGGHLSGRTDFYKQLVEELPSAEKTDGDLISRQAAIDIVVFECGKWTGLAKEISKQLKQLPSAEKTDGESK